MTCPFGVPFEVPFGVPFEVPVAMRLGSRDRRSRLRMQGSLAGDIYPQFGRVLR